MTRLLVTGGTGMIGQACILHLASRGLEVHAVSRHSQCDFPNVEWHFTDLLADSAASTLVRHISPTHLLHLAWETTPGTYWNDPSNVDWLQATLNLYRSFQEEGGKCFVGVGTCAEYDWNDKILSEELTPLRPRTLYGHCKASAGNIITSLVKQSDCRAVWGRVFFLYGGKEHPSRLVPSIIGHLLKGEPVYLTDGSQIRDYMHLDDVARALVDLLLDTDVRGAVNVASGNGLSIRDIAVTLGDLIGRVDLLRFGQVSRPQNDPPQIIGDVARLRHEVGFAPTITLHEGLRMTLNAWKE